MADLSPETRDAVREGCKRSAATVLPMVLDYLGHPRTLLDVGAGEGWWSNEAERLGVFDVHAVDIAPRIGIWNDEHGAHRYEIEAWDAETSAPLPTRGVSPLKWDLALCLEMAEHVSPQAGDHLVSELCRVADAVLWSAAIPGQGGDGHVNEQWPDYWQERFLANEWVLSDPFRDDLWQHPDVEPWYRANLLLAKPRPERGIYYGGPPRALVDPVTWAHHRGVPAPSA